MTIPRNQLGRRPPPRQPCLPLGDEALYYGWVQQIAAELGTRTDLDVILRAVRNLKSANHEYNDDIPF